MTNTERFTSSQEKASIESTHSRGGAVIKAVFNGLEQRETILHLPATFAEAHSMSGHSIEDVIGDDLEIDVALKSWGPSTENDRLFAEKQNLIERSEKITEFTKKFMSIFPDKFKKGAYNVQSPWMQHNSRARIKAEIAGSIEKPTSRIYLNPELEDSFYIYAKIFKEAESQGLRFSAKVFGYMGEGDKKNDYAAYFEKESDKQVKLDPIVFYGYPESQDALLQIVEKVYKEHQDVFIGRSLGGVPMQIAPGFGVGMEPTGRSGSESLTGHRDDAFVGVLSRISKDPRWEAASIETRKRRFVHYVRAHAAELNIDPDNIAFEPK